MSTVSTRSVGFQTEESAHLRSFLIRILKNLKQSVFDNDTFFEIVGSKSYEHFRNFQCSPWTQNRETGLFEREMRWVAIEMNVRVDFPQSNLTCDKKGSLKS